MADPSEDVLFQSRISKELHDRFVTQRERWGMSNRELFERILIDTLPRLEEAVGPPFSRPSS